MSLSSTLRTELTQHLRDLHLPTIRTKFLDTIAHTALSTDVVAALAMATSTLLFFQGTQALNNGHGTAFGDGSRDEQARWEGGVRQFLGAGLVEPQGNRVFCITAEGYQAADVLQRSK